MRCIAVTFFAFASLHSVSADDPIPFHDFSTEELIAMEFEGWRYPNAELEKSTDNDLKSTEGNPDRESDLSTNYRVVLKTPDAAQDVTTFYRDLVERKSRRERDMIHWRQPDWEDSWSQSDHSRPGLTLHVLTLDTPHTSTTIVISRLLSEESTSILWLRHKKYIERSGILRAEDPEG